MQGELTLDVAAPFSAHSCARVLRRLGNPLILVRPEVEALLFVKRHQLRAAMQHMRAQVHSILKQFLCARCVRVRVRP